MIKKLMIVIVLATLTACSYEQPPMKSPCVGADGSPCGPKRDVNGWWIS